MNPNNSPAYRHFGHHQACPPPDVALSPIGVFWDIENCAVPKCKSALAVVNCLRDKFFKKHREAEFICVCDINKESKEVIKELNLAQVTVAHINATCKNAADDKLRQSLRRFADTHSSPATVVLVSGDVNFTAELSDLRHRHNLYVIVIHSKHAPEALLSCAHEHYSFDQLVGDIPFRSPTKAPQTNNELLISNLPTNRDLNQLRHRLKQLSDNCGGRVVSVTSSLAILRFPAADAATRAKKRMDQEDVFGNKISVTFPPKADSETHDRSPQSCSTKPAENNNHVSTINTIPNWKNKTPSWSSVPNNKSSTDQSNQDLNNAQSSTSYSSNRHALLLQQQIYQEQQQYLFNEKSSRSASTSPDSISSQSYNDQLYSLQPSRPVFPYPVRLSPAVKTDNLFRPIRLSPPSINIGPSNAGEPIELHVTNFDQKIPIKDVKKILITIFREHVMVLHVSVILQPDGTITGLVKVPSMHDAQYAISQLHRRKIGRKRIHISLPNNKSPSPQIIRSEVTSLLNEVTGNSLPLFKFIELFEKRYHQNISVSDLYKMRDIVEIQELESGRIVCINPEASCQSPINSDNNNNLQEEVQELLEKPYCELHCTEMTETGWAETEEYAELPMVKEPLKTLATKVHTLLQSHNGTLPLNSFPVCCASEFDNLVTVEEGGVPLEHLISCVPGILITQSSRGIKKIQWAKNKLPLPDPLPRTTSPPLAAQLALFCREIVDLLKNSPHCLMAFGKFIPSYHHHFGRQCRVADYGFTKLVDLFDAVTHVLHVMGTGNRKVLTLTHRSQVKRFTADLLRMLKSQASKQIPVSEFAAIYSKCIGKPFDISDYGVCEIMDMLNDLPLNIVEVLGQGMDTIIEIPKREQTPEEIERTQQFAVEVVELLKHTPQCLMVFDKFIPAYHHHFGRQCRVADFGFTKLIELFEAIPLILEVMEVGEEKMLKLSQRELMKVLSDQVVTLLKTQDNLELPLENFMSAFTHYHGYSLHLEDFGVSNERALLAKVKHVAKIQEVAGGPIISLVDRSQLSKLATRCLSILMAQPDEGIKFEDFCTIYRREFGQSINIESIEKEMGDYIQFNSSSSIISLQLLQRFARDVWILLHRRGGRMQLHQFEAAFLEHFNDACQPAKFGFPSILTLLQAISHVVSIKGKSFKKMIVLKQEFPGPRKLETSQSKKSIELVNSNNRESSSTPSTDSAIVEEYVVEGDDVDGEDIDELLSFDVPNLDFMNDPVPSGIPSPELQPDTIEPTEKDLIRFDSPSPWITDLITGVTDEISSVSSSLDDMLLESDYVPMAAPDTFSLPVPNFWIARPLLNLQTDNHISASLNVNGICNHSNHEMPSDSNSSTQSTPTHRLSKGCKGRSRVAAKFSVPLQ